jgi:hypothetical protein
MNRDKKSICLVCKELAIVGTPLLYTDMVVYADHLNEDLVSTLSVPGRHHGLAHIRTLRVATEYNRPDYYNTGQMSALCGFQAVRVST